MPSTPVLVLIALTVLACAFIAALLLRIRAHRLQVTPVFGSYGGIDRASNPMWQNRHVIDDDQEIVAGQHIPMDDVRVGETFGDYLRRTDKGLGKAKEEAEK